VLTWLKNVLFRGLIILIPLVLLWITIRELFELLIGFAGPIADLFPAGSFDEIVSPELISALLIVGTAVLLGVLASIPPVRAAGGWLERNTVGHLPLYRMIKTFITAFLEMEDAAAFRPALIEDDEGGAEPCYVIEDVEQRPYVVVLVPWSPASFAGSVKLVPRKRIRRLDLTFDELSLSLANFGLGMNEILPRAKHRAEKDQSRTP
jgi:uncharacterized membrane protein